MPKKFPKPAHYYSFTVKRWSNKMLLAITLLPLISTLWNVAAEPEPEPAAHSKLFYHGFLLPYNESKNSTGLTRLFPVSEPEVMKPPKGTQRTLFAFKGMMLHYLGPEAAKFKHHGNYCSYKPNATDMDPKVIDGCDRCCYNHDVCYATAATAKSIGRAPIPHSHEVSLKASGSASASDSESVEIGIMRTRKERYCVPTKKNYFFSKVPGICIDRKDTCGRRVCECDLELARCLRIGMNKHNYCGPQYPYA